MIAQSESIRTGDKAGDVFSTGEKNLCSSDSREAKGVSRQVCRHRQGSGLGLGAIHTLQCACESPGSLKHELVREEETRKRGHCLEGGRVGEDRIRSSKNPMQGALHELGMWFCDRSVYT